MVAISPTSSNESYVAPSPCAWLRSRAPVPTTYAPACEPLYAFREVLKNRTSRTRGMADSCTELVARKFAICIEIWQVELEDGIRRVYFHKYAYVHGDPISHVDPTGKFAGLLIGVGVQMLLPGPGDFIRGSFEALLTAYAANLAYDVEWALDMSQDDSWSSRSDDSWVLAAIGQGLHDSFNVQTPFGTVNLLDIFGGASNTSGTASDSLSMAAMRPGSNVSRSTSKAPKVSRVRFGASINGVYTTRAGAFNAAKDRAGIPTSQTATRQWTIRGPHSEYQSGATVRHADKTHHGRIYEFEVAGPGGQKRYKYLVVHDQDSNHGGIGHVHSAESKLGSRNRLMPGEKYHNLDKDQGLDPIPYASLRGARR